MATIFCPWLKVGGPGTIVWSSKCACLRWEIVGPFNTLHSTQFVCGYGLCPVSPPQRVCGLLMPSLCYTFACLPNTSPPSALPWRHADGDRHQEEHGPLKWNFVLRPWGWAGGVHFLSQVSDKVEESKEMCSYNSLVGISYFNSVSTLKLWRGTFFIFCSGECDLCETRKDSWNALLAEVNISKNFYFCTTPNNGPAQESSYAW